MTELSTSGFRAGCGPALVDTWCRSLPADPITARRFRDLVLLDPSFDPDGLRLAWRDGEPIGAAYAVRRRVPLDGADLEPERGWIPFFFVDPRHRGAGVGRALLGDALDWLRGHGCREAHFASYTPNYVLPGLDRSAYPEAAALLEGLGFRTLYQAAAMDRSLVGYAVPDQAYERAEELRGKGYEFGAPSDDDLVDLVRLARDEFNPDWGRAIREAVAGGLPLDRIVLARDPDGELVGWAMFGTYEGIVERFGPFGVLPDRRGLGLGEVLLHLSLTRMRAAGAHSAWFLWTGERSPAGHLYRKAGFATTRLFDVMRAEL
jgi:GNAT superfamily N-acetyltransferase